MTEVQSIYDLRCPRCGYEYNVEVLFTGPFECKGCQGKLSFHPVEYVNQSYKEVA